MPLGAEHERDPVEPGHRLLERYGVVGERERHRGEAALAESAGSASYQSGSRVHGTVKTAPIATLTARR